MTTENRRNASDLCVGRRVMSLYLHLTLFSTRQAEAAEVVYADT